MESLVDLVTGETTLRNGVVVLVDCQLYSHGTLSVLWVQELKIKRRGKNTFYFELLSGKLWQGAKESALMQEEVKEVPPCERWDRRTYLPYRWGDLEVVEFRNGGRFFSSKAAQENRIFTFELYSVGSLYSDAYWMEVWELKDHLGEVLDDLGVPDATVDEIRDMILDKK